MTKPKPVNWELITDPEIIQFTQDLITKYHGGQNRLQNLNYILMWKHNTKPDQDGYIQLTTLTKPTDQTKELRPHDIIIGINKTAWQLLDKTQKATIIDAQLQRIVISTDKEGNPKEDDRSRTIYRIKKLIDEETSQRRHNHTYHEIMLTTINKLTPQAQPNSYIHNILNQT